MGRLFDGYGRAEIARAEDAFDRDPALREEVAAIVAGLSPGARAAFERAFLDALIGCRRPAAAVIAGIEAAAAVAVRGRGGTDRDGGV